MCLMSHIGNSNFVNNVQIYETLFIKCDVLTHILELNHESLMNISRANRSFIPE